MKKKIMILGASILQLPAIKKAKELNLDIIVADMNPYAIGFKEEGIEKEVISTIDTAAVLSAAKKHNIDGIMTLATDMPMRTVAAVAEEMGLIAVNEDTAFKATNKAAMREALKEYGVPIPEFFRVSDYNEYQTATSRFKTAFIVKPADSSGSRGICLVENIEDADAAKSAYDYSRQYSRCGDVLVEEFMHGPEVSVETLSVDGVCNVIQITDKITTGAPHFVEMGHSQPTQLPIETAVKIAEVAKAANKALGIMNGPSHTEIIVTAEGPKIVELGARLGGDCITTHLVPLSTGVDMVENCIKIALGEKPDIECKFNKGSAIRYFQQTAGVIKKISGLDKAADICGVKEIQTVYGVNDKITEIDGSAARMGFVIAQGTDAKNAVDICQKAISQIEISIERE